MGQKTAPTVGSKVSSASSPAVLASTRKSSVLKSAFAPSQFQLHLFASVIQSFDSHQLRIHDTTTGRLRSQHETRSGAKITCLDWGYYGAAYRERRQSISKKKRKRGQNNNDGAVIAYGTTTSEICMLSPFEGKIVGTLINAHERGVRDFKFDPSDYLQGWSIGEDARLIQWDLAKDEQLRTIALPDPAINFLAPPFQSSPQILCASSTPFAIDITSSDDFRIDRFDSFKNAIHSLIRSSSSDAKTPEYFLATDSDRYINVYDISQKKLVHTLVAGSGVVNVDVSCPTEETPDFLRQQMLSVVTKAGLVELFSQPFAESKQVNGDLMSNRKSLSKKASASVRLISPDSKTKQVPIFAASLQGPDLFIVSADGGVDLSFQKLRWQDEGNGEVLFDGTKELVKVRSASTLNTAILNGIKDTTKSHVDESRTVVVNGGAGGPLHTEAIEIVSSESEEEAEEDESTDEASTQLNDEEEEDQTSDSGEDKEMVDVGDVGVNNGENQEMDDAAQPTFGELLASKHPHEISIASANQPSASTFALKPGQQTIPSGMSLGTVLTQSLRTNDTNLLEACLHTLDVTIVKNTIQRLDSSLAGNLLAKLAERLATRPGRYGHLITWVQWTCIAHGGAIASMPDVTSKVRTLYQVLSQRAKTLDPLLLLKGKLDMLDAQLTYRKQLALQRPGKREGQNEPAMIYIEGRDNWDSEDDGQDDSLDEEADAERPVKRRRARKDLENLIGYEESEEDEDEHMVLQNGAEESSDEEEDENDDEQGVTVNGQRRGLLDDEAEVSSAEDSDPDDDESSPAASSSDEDSEDGEEEEEEEELDEEGSEMDSFINDGSIDIDEGDEEEVHVPGDESELDEDEDEDAGELELQPAPKSKSNKTKETSTPISKSVKKKSKKN